MLRSMLLSFSLAAFVAGCTSEPASVGGDTPTSETTTVVAVDTAADAVEPGAVVGDAAEDPALTVDAAKTPSVVDEAAADEGGSSVVVLSPANTKIGFVGTHTGDDPKPRKGSFGEFTGKAAVAGGAVRSIEVDIKTESLKTDIDKLTNHLKSTDFFDVRQFPNARFVSTSIEAGEGDQVKIVGDLTLLGKTKSISFPASVKTTDGGLQLKSEFTIDRTDFGMDYGLDGVEKPVTLNVSIDAT